MPEAAKRLCEENHIAGLIGEIRRISGNFIPWRTAATGAFPSTGWQAISPPPSVEKLEKSPKNRKHIHYQQLADIPKKVR
ncbi:MAG: hypothetical protein ACFB13_06025 [Kiloniellaceae bacterium]